MTLQTYQILEGASAPLKVAKTITIHFFFEHFGCGNQHTFSTLYFLKSNLKNHINKHLHTIVGMFS
jgi:hypothetical protein